jgi:hypothetical protein
VTRSRFDRAEAPPQTEDPDPIDLARGLGADGARHREGPEGEAADEGAPVHHSMTWTALRFSTSSNFVGCSTSRSAGLPPLRILSIEGGADAGLLDDALGHSPIFPSAF